MTSVSGDGEGTREAHNTVSTVPTSQRAPSCGSSLGHCSVQFCPGEDCPLLPYPRLAHSVPEKGRCDCRMLSPLSSVSSWQYLPGQPPLAELSVSIHPHQAVTATWNTGTKERALLIIGCQMTQLLDDPLKSLLRICEKDL